MRLHPAPLRIRLAGASLALAVACAGAPGFGAPASSARITPNFKDADITQIIEAVTAATGKNFIVDPRVRAQVTMLSSTPMSPEQFYQAFLAILQVHGFMAVPAGNIIKILPEANLRTLPGDDLPQHVSSSSDEVVTQVIAVRNVSAAQLVPVLRPLMPQNAQLAAVNGANMLILSDRASNVNRMMRIVARIDQTTSGDIDVIPLQSATAADTVRVLGSLIGQATDGGNTVKVVADDRSNSVLLSGDATQRLKLRTLIANLDTPLDTGGETYVRYLQYAKAEDLASKLKEQITSPGAKGATGAPGAAPAAAGPAGAATISLAGGTGTIWADKDTNALVITAPQRTMRAINAVIDKLDIRRAMVQVEAIIVEVTADKTADLGINWVLDGSNSKLAVGGFIEPVGGASAIDLYNLSKGTSTNASALTGTTFGIGRLNATGVNFGMIVRALQGDTRTNIISTPSITTRDNEEAKIEVAQEVPFITGQYTGTTGTSSAFQTVQRQQVGTILKVTPQINSGDAVLLKLEVESSSLAASSAGAVDLITNKRTISTSVQIPDGGTLVLGGLIKDQITNSEQRVPWLGRIPLIGELFRTRDTGKTKTNLLVFLQPHILRNDAQAAMETDAKYDYVRGLQKQIGRENTVAPLEPFQKAEPLPPLRKPRNPPAGAPAPAAPAPGAAGPGATGASPKGAPAGQDSPGAASDAAPPDAQADPQGSSPP
jgi:general secretion pathway protein D